jgi:hypothetical protein
LTAFFSYDESPRWPGVLLEFWAQAVRNTEVSRRLTQAYGGWRRQIASLFENAVAAGLRAGSPDDAATVVLAAHDGFAVQTAIGAPGGRGMSAADLADSLVAPLERVGQEERRSVAM